MDSNSSLQSSESAVILARFRAASLSPWDKEIYKIGIIRNRISTLKNNFISAEEYRSNTELVQQDKIAKRTEFGRIYQIYVKIPKSFCKSYSIKN